MAVLTNRIDTFDFMALMGPLVPPRKQFAIDVRAGIPGVQITDLQKHGLPFTLRSIVDCASYPDGQALYNDYLETTLSEGLVELIQSNYDTSTAGWLVKVLDCRMLSLQQSATIAGGLQYTSGFILVCEWDLIGEALT